MQVQGFQKQENNQTETQYSRAFHLSTLSSQAQAQAIKS
jgi:hypothetical protein